MSKSLFPILKDVFVGSGWAGVFMLIGFLITIYSTSYRLEHYKLQDQIEKLDDQWGVVCISQRERMECRFQRLLDKGI